MTKSNLSIENHLHASEYRWFAIRTRFRGEKMAFRLLSRKGIQVYLPLQEVVRKYTRKIKRLELPLISGYLFVKITHKEYVRVLETEQVVDFVRFSRNLISIPDEEIELVKRVLGEGWEVEAQEGDMRRGDQVEIIAGNLTGLQGYLLEDPEQCQVRMNLERLGYTLCISINRKLLRRIK